MVTGSRAVPQLTSDIRRLRLEPTIPLAPPPDQFGMLFMSYPGCILPQVNAPTEKNRLNVPLDFACETMVSSQNSSIVRKSKRGEIAQLRDYSGNRVGVPGRVSNDEIVPTAEPYDFIAMKHLRNLIPVGHFCDLSSIEEDQIFVVVPAFLHGRYSIRLSSRAICAPGA